MPTDKNFKILIVEDEEPLKLALESKLKEEGYEVFSAVDGLEGLRLALTEKPDLILLDILMPTMDGIRMLEDLREDDWGRKARVIVLTNLDHAETARSAKYQGVEKFLIKADYELEEVIQLIKQSLLEQLS